MKKPVFTSFAEICAATGKNEQDYNLPAEASNKVKFQICTDRLWLYAKAYNKGKPVVFTDTDQWKYTPWHKIIPDASRPFGFRLSYDVYVYTFTFAGLGARPPFLHADNAIEVGQNFIEEFEQWYYYMTLAFQE